MTYFGGKGQDGVYQAIINQIPMHDRYIELFLGGGALMRKKKPARYSFGYDFDRSVILAFPYLPRTEVFRADAFDVLSAIDKNAFDGSTFLYCDPPYPLWKRGKTRYKHDFVGLDHVMLLDRLNNLGCSIAISTYPNGLYSEMLSDWRVIEYNSTDRSGAVRTENLFMNYPEPEILHDNRFLGENAGSRQDIKRRIARTKKRILGWNTHERQKLLREIWVELPEFEKELLNPDME